MICYFYVSQVHVIFLFYTMYSWGALPLRGIYKTYLWHFMGQNDPLFSSLKCSGFAMTMLQVRNDSNTDVTGSQCFWARVATLFRIFNAQGNVGGTIQSLSRDTFSAISQQHVSSSIIINKSSLILVIIHYHPPLIHCIHIQRKIRVLVNTTSNVSCNSKCLRVHLCMHFVETVDHW